MTRRTRFRVTSRPTTETLRTALLSLTRGGRSFLAATAYSRIKSHSNAQIDAELGVLVREGIFGVANRRFYRRMGR